MAAVAASPPRPPGSRKQRHWQPGSALAAARSQWASTIHICRLAPPLPQTTYRFPLRPRIATLPTVTLSAYGANPATTTITTGTGAVGVRGAIGLALDGVPIYSDMDESEAVNRDAMTSSSTTAVTGAAYPNGPAGTFNTCDGHAMRQT